MEKLEEAMSDGFLKEYISPLLICDTNTCKVTEEIMEDIYDRCQVLVLDAEGLHADQHAIEVVENNMEDRMGRLLGKQKEGSNGAENTIYAHSSRETGPKNLPHGIEW